MDLVLLGNEPRLRAFIAKHLLSFEKLNERQWGSYALGIKHFTMRTVVYDRPFGSAWKVEEAGAIALFEFVENNQTDRNEIQVLLGISGIEELKALVTEIKQNPLQEAPILPVTNE